MNEPSAHSPKILRVLVVCPSWVGDVVMATPALRLIRGSMPGAFIGALVRPGIDQILAGTDFFDEIHVDRAAGVMGPKLAGAKIRPRKYDAAVLLSNSLRTALVTRIAGIPMRIGYARDGRGVLLTERLIAPQQAADQPGKGRWAMVSACVYYWHAAQYLCDVAANDSAEFARAELRADTTLPAGVHMELATTEDEERDADAVLSRAGVRTDDPRDSRSERFAILNPGGNNDAKRWPAERFTAIGTLLRDQYSMDVLVSGSPNERELCEQIATMIGTGAVALPACGITLGALKAIIERSSIMLTNDTGPRHIAAAFGTPVISLFGPTDHRWTTIPTPGGEKIIVADPTLEHSKIANDHPDRCSIDRISIRTVAHAVGDVLGTVPD